MIPKKILNILSPDNQKVLAKLIIDIDSGRHDPVMFTENLLGLNLHSHQKIWLWLTTRTQLQKAVDEGKKIGYNLLPIEELEKNEFLKNVLVPSNRWGKTFVTAVKHLWYCFYKIGYEGSAEDLTKIEYTTLNLSSHSEQSNVCFEYCEKILKSEIYYPILRTRNNCRIGFFLGKSTRNPINIMYFNNNSKFSSRTIGEERASNIQGGSQNYISYDECCRSYNLEKEIEPNIMPRLADSNGPLDLLSTPDKDSPSLQYYYELCEMGRSLRDGWFLMTGEYDNNIFIPEDKRTSFKERIKDPKVYEQVVKGNFVFVGGRMFSGEDIKNMWHKDIQYVPLPILSLINNQPNGLPIEYGHKYITAVDFARSEGGDATVIYTFDYTYKPYKLAYAVRFTGVPIMTQVQEISGICKYYNSALFFDSTGFGGAIMEDLLSKQAVGVDFQKGKATALAQLKLDLSEGSFACPMPNSDNTVDELRKELSSYKLEDKKLQTDCVMALAIAAYGICELSYQTKPIYFKLYKK